MYEIRQEADSRGVHIIFTGVITAAEVNQARSEILADPHSAAHRYQLWDCLGASSHTFSPEEVRGFAMRAAGTADERAHVRVALIAPANFFRGLDRLFHVSSEVWTHRQSATFTSLREAREWSQREKSNQKADRPDVNNA